jgi:photosystem II stability/assembly factor-like uncharacterized protein
MRYFIYGVVAMILATSAAAQAQWKPCGTRPVESLYGDPHVALSPLLKHKGAWYVNSIYGLTKSTDSCITWEYLTPDVTVLSSGCNEKFLFIVTSTGLQQSSDGGSTWSQVVLPRTNILLKLVLVSGPVIYALADSAAFRSIDDGKTWNEVSVIQHRNSQTYHGVAGDNDPYMFWSNGYQLFRSTNRGESWTDYTKSVVEYGYVNRVVKYNNVVACLTSNLSLEFHDTKLVISTNYGETWSPVKEMDSNFTSAIAVSSTTLYALATDKVLYRSVDNGKTFLAAKDVEKNVERGVVALGNMVIANKSLTCSIVSNDHGDTWSITRSGPRKCTVRSMIVRNGKVLVVSNDAHLYLGSRKGMLWEYIPLTTSSRASCAVVKDDSILVGTLGSGLYRTTNNGTTWSSIQERVSDQFINCLHNGGSTIYAGSSGVMQSNDFGATWQARNINLPQKGVYALAKSDTTLYAGVFGNSVYSGGINSSAWYSNAIMPADANIWCLTESNSAMYAGSDYGNVYRKAKTEIDWKSIGPATTQSITALLAHSSLLFAGTDAGKIFVSNDEGITWTEQSAGLPASVITSLIVNDSIVLAGTFGYGVYLLPLSDVKTTVSSISTTDNDPAFSVTPQPAAVATKIHIPPNIYSTSAPAMQLVDVYGSRVQNPQLSLHINADSSMTIMWDCSVVPSGRYVLNVVDEDKLHYIPIVVIR